MKLGSLFDGIGGFPLAATMNGYQTGMGKRDRTLSDGGNGIPVPGDEAHGRYHKTAWRKPARGGYYCRRFPVSGFVRGREEGRTVRGSFRLIHGAGQNRKGNEKTGWKEDEEP